MKVLIASHPKVDSVFAEIYENANLESMWAIVWQIDNELRLEIFSRENGDAYKFDLLETINALNEAKTRLTGDASAASD